MDSSADTAAWVAAGAALLALALAAWQVFGARAERVRQHDIETLERMLAIITDPQVANNSPWSPTLFMALYVTLSSNAKAEQKTINAIDPEVVDVKGELVRDAAHIATELLTATRSRVGLGDHDWNKA